VNKAICPEAIREIRGGGNEGTNVSPAVTSLRRGRHVEDGAGLGQRHRGGLVGNIPRR
jgi:hypothetical protein